MTRSECCVRYMSTCNGMCKISTGPSVDVTQAKPVWAILLKDKDEVPLPAAVRSCGFRVGVVSGV
ncbi:hypothetical protein DOTSEDRAFT_74388 [Dothistroma septosporum NZE10]|uniref:Uncharacterized protein n=1 Tax=Dothistroma septosporum (strain NZE10 / CBS 128990) TaxID=675120 RepID=N1PHM6_DOTSN|nr:hypothetical protein DOTSEDRAFT_74388 [Dothistroma septosporum NZE10]